LSMDEIAENELKGRWHRDLISVVASFRSILVYLSILLENVLKEI